MSLRKNRILKILALLLFTMEFLSPVLFSPPSSEEEKDIFQQTHNQNNILSFLAEEAGSEEEREGKEHKGCLSLSEFTFTESFVYLFSEAEFHTPVYQYNASLNRPIPLFKLHRVFQVWSHFL